MTTADFKPAYARWLPTEPPRPCPDILTAEEAAVYLRLPGAASVRKFYRDGRIRGRRIGKHIRFKLSDLDAFVEKQLT